MPLTLGEREFLDAYVYEATHDPFTGPATKDLQQRGIFYSNLSWMLTAYGRELSARGEVPDGMDNPNPPPSPWATFEEAKRRNEELRGEWEPRMRGEAKAAVEEHVG